jgi:hypothetical protein
MGKGVFTWTSDPTRSKYDGEWKDNKAHGRGVLWGKDGKVLYEGEWAGDAKHGEGTETDATGQYTGSFVQGKKHGAGKWVSANGLLEFKGEWKVPSDRIGCACASAHPLVVCVAE